MNKEIKEIRIKNTRPIVIPDGLYAGTLSGYTIELTINKVDYIIDIVEGIRGVNFPVVVEVKDGVITYDFINN